MKPQRHRRELIAEARSAFSDCIERFPLSSVVDYCYQHLVGSYLEERQWSRAKILLTRYLASYPEARLGAEAWYQLGLCSLYLDQPEEASRALWKVILQHPGSPFAAHAAVSLIQTASPEEFFDRAQSLVEEGRWDAAHPLLHALSLQEGSPLRSEVVRLLIHAEFRRSRWERAARLASKWLADFPDDEAEVWYVYGRSLAALGRFDEAATALQRTLDLDPDPGRESELQVLLDSVRFLAKSSPPRVPPERTGKEGRP
jgi:tetratricopeptide (TPR) repeat protein